MAYPARSVIVGIDNGGTMNNATVLDPGGRFLVEQMLELPSRVREGPAVAIPALADSFQQVLDVTGVDQAQVRAVGLDTPGPASADGVLSSRGATNFGHPDWGGFNIRAALEERLGLPVVYTNDANAAALYAHHIRFGPDAAAQHSSVAAIVGTGLGGGLVEAGQVVSGAAGMAAELGHVQIPLDGLLANGQPVPMCNCGLAGDAESVASLTGIEKNLLPYWLTQFPGHELAAVQPLAKAARLVRGFGAAGDPMALADFRAAGDGAGPHLLDRGDVHRPRHLLRRWRRRRGRAGVQPVVPGPGAGAHHAALGAAAGGAVRAGAGPGHGGRAGRGARGPRRRRRARIELLRGRSAVVPAGPRVDPGVARRVPVP